MLYNFSAAYARTVSFLKTVAVHFNVLSMFKNDSQLQSDWMIFERQQTELKFKLFEQYSKEV